MSDKYHESIIPKYCSFCQKTLAAPFCVMFHPYELTDDGERLECMPPTGICTKCCERFQKQEKAVTFDQIIKGFEEAKKKQLVELPFGKNPDTKLIVDTWCEKGESCPAVILQMPAVATPTKYSLPYEAVLRLRDRLNELFPMAEHPSPPGK